MTTQQMEMFLAIDKEGTLKKASEALFISQPALSQAIQKMERHLGLPLFDRSCTPMKFTEAGKLFLTTAKEMKISQVALDRKLTDLTQLSSGSLKIGTSSFRATSLLAKSIRDFSEKYPRVQLELITDQITPLTEKLLNGEIDMVIESDCFDHNLFHTIELFTETYYLAVPSNHSLCNLWNANLLTADDIVLKTPTLTSAAPVDLSAYSNYSFIFLNKETSIRRIYDQIFKECKINPRADLTICQLETATSLVNNGVGFAFFPDTLIRCYGTMLSHTNFFKINKPSVHQTVVVATSKKHYTSHAMSHYINMLTTLS